MTVEVYRLHSSRYPAKSGRGAALYGGRWNPPGLETIYAAQSRSLAALEILVHYAVLPRDFVLTPIRIPEDRVLIMRLREEEPYMWPFPYAHTQHLGMRWLPKVAVLSVSSAIIPQERIYVLNPAHAEFQHIEFLESERFQFDPRLKPIG